ncbi:DUF1835 domain-containing protein [Acidisphaera sp. S103]|uniref:DUF1835 domain-containing protein n=1 Tax=Acidisphaera sp. S103 TaxID=1747223 RepID=UPI00131DE6CB|nr:DUF1835 domain-containing protein [Acidisphaera sp. S103]
MIDDDRPTLHIRCGSDIRDTLRSAGFGGEFLEYSDPVHDGPLPGIPDLVAARARILAAGPGQLMGFSEAQCLAGLRQAEQRLSSAHQYQRVVLWFEHDSYDQLILARCLSRLAEGPLPECLELICIDRHPDIPRFNGLGQLGPTALAALWPARKSVTPEQIALGQAIWAALRQPDPTGLQAIAETATPALPIAAPALWRHLRELPGVADGLSLTQRLVLDILTESPTPIGRILAAMVNGREPLVFMGDIGLLGTVEAMARTNPPALTIEPGEKPFPRIATITDTGRQVVAERIDYLSLRPPERWVGNILADGQWRWDETAGSIARTT